MGCPCSRRGGEGEGALSASFCDVKQAQGGHAACLMSSFVQRSIPGLSAQFFRSFSIFAHEQTNLLAEEMFLAFNVQFLAPLGACECRMTEINVISIQRTRVV